MPDPTPMTSTDPRPLARVRLHPFVIVIVSMVIASVGGELWQMDPGWEFVPLLRDLGRILMVLGGVTLIVAYGSMARSHTTIDPRRHSTAVVTSGVYRISRNPIYLGWFLVLLGAGLENASLFEVAASVLMIGLLHWMVVLPEEGYMEATFGEDYVRYKKRVRRWL